jgi:glucose-1-phosphate adenylyltransferase
MNTNGISRISTGSHRLARETTAVVLAGGRGTRLGALTRNECKPALPFGGFYRNIDFSLSNCVNSGIYHIGVATQYKDTSLLRHMARVWPDSGEPGAGVVEPWRTQLQAGGGSYRGTADAVFQNWARIDALDARLVLILAGDHVYKMDYRPMLEQHVACQADITVGCVEVPTEEARDYGVMSIDASNRIVGFVEKPHHPQSMHGRPGRTLGSMGIYVFNRDLLGRLLREDASTETSSHDFGRDLLPRLYSKMKVFAYPFTQDAAVGGGYWRDVGTISAYWRAHMELLDGIPGFPLDDPRWPLRSDERSLNGPRCSTRFLGQTGQVTDALLAAGCEVDQATVRRSVLFAHVKVAEHSDVSNAVVLPHAVIGRNCVLSDVIVTSGVRIPDGIIITRSRHSAAGAAPTLVSADKNGTPLCLGPANATRGRQSVAIHPRRYDHAKATISGRQ